MSNYHGEIMNIWVNCDNLSRDESDAFDIAYKVGHRDARHEAAQLGQHADCVIEELRCALQEVHDRTEVLANLDNVVAIVKIREIIEKALELGGDE